MSEVPVQDFFEIASHEVTPACHNFCRCSHSPNAFRFKAIWSYKMWKSRTPQLLRLHVKQQFSKTRQPVLTSLYRLVYIVCVADASVNIYCVG